MRPPQRNLLDGVEGIVVVNDGLQHQRRWYDDWAERRTQWEEDGHTRRTQPFARSRSRRRGSLPQRRKQPVNPRTLPTHDDGLTQIRTPSPEPSRSAVTQHLAPPSLFDGRAGNSRHHRRCDRRAIQLDS
ncbi:hypothetical protein PHYPSEUDO_012329 [Phytophthora pseudosyringae]|uniref:Uncharacterized protein n=1 Tax=Phytophthora pseudosyringae TaxID=221518 RepID=A0A8T1V9S6_9STRA|nr:hypothetical protein PHYPSEUDO_012329 [Phytophthora pseudosyringae]